VERTWFSGVANELARCLTDAEASAKACEDLLESVRDAGVDETTKRVLRALVPPAAIARVLIELIDQPPEMILAACRLCRESAREAISDLEAIHVETSPVVAALRASADSCEQLLDAAG
jgi:hypothetical protein